MKKERPLSPHLQIYKPQITSVLSILHRFTGVILSVGYIGLCFWLFICAGYPTVAHKIEPYFSTIYFKLLGWGLVFSLLYHLFNGLRHLMWDMGKWYSIKATEKSGYLVVFLTLVSTLVFIYWTGMY